MNLRRGRRRNCQERDNDKDFAHLEMEEATPRLSHGKKRDRQRRGFVW